MAFLLFGDMAFITGQHVQRQFSPDAEGLPGLAEHVRFLRFVPVTGFVIRQIEYAGQPCRRLQFVDLQIVGGKVYGVTMGLTPEAVVSLVQLHAGMAIVVKRAARHAVPAYLQTQRLGSHACRDILPDRLEDRHSDISLRRGRLRGGSSGCSAMIRCPVLSMVWTFFHTMSMLRFSAESDFNSAFDPSR